MGSGRECQLAIGEISFCSGWCPCSGRYNGQRHDIATGCRKEERTCGAATSSAHAAAGAPQFVDASSSLMRDTRRSARCRTVAPTWLRHLLQCGTAGCSGSRIPKSRTIKYCGCRAGCRTGCRKHEARLWNGDVSCNAAARAAQVCGAARHVGCLVLKVQLLRFRHREFSTLTANTSPVYR